MPSCQLDVALLCATLLLTPQFVILLTERVSLFAAGKIPSSHRPLVAYVPHLKLSSLIAKVVIDARSAAATAVLGLLLIFFFPIRIILVNFYLTMCLSG